MGPVLSAWYTKKKKKKNEDMALPIGDHNPQDRMRGRPVQQPILRHYGRCYNGAWESKNFSLQCPEILKLKLALETQVGPGCVSVCVHGGKWWACPSQRHQPMRYYFQWNRKWSRYLSATCLASRMNYSIVRKPKAIILKQLYLHLSSL